MGIGAEIRHRMNGAIPNMNPRLKKFLKDKDVEMKPRINAAKTWILGKLMHLSESWPEMTNSELKFVSVKVVKTFQIVLDCDFCISEKNYLSDSEVMSKTLGVTPRVVLLCHAHISEAA